MPLSATYSLYHSSINEVIGNTLSGFVPQGLEVSESVGDTVIFMDSAIPAIKEGTYMFSAHQSLNPSYAGQGNFYPDAQSQTFHITGPRFQIDPADIRAVYPPAHSSGDHAYVLPHIAFNRHTLPWEIDRNHIPWIDDDTSLEKDPWIALLLFTDTEVPTIKTETLGDLNLDPEVYLYNSAEEQVKTIEVPESLLQETFPESTVQNLQYLAHVRERTVNGTLDSIPFIVGNRLPKTNTTSVVHVVSLKDFPATTSGTDTVKLISLYTWTFTCVENKPAFQDLVNNLDARAFRLYQNDWKETGVDTGGTGTHDLSIENQYYLQGFVPMPHYMREGLQTLSWYRGPLLPDQPPFTDPGFGGKLALSADDYLRFDGSSKMLEISYSAAWQIGRMLTLKNKNVALAIQAYKRQVAQMIKTQNLNPANNDPNNYLSFLQDYTLTPQQQQLLEYAEEMASGELTSGVQSPDLNADPIVAKWITQLMTLSAVPFSYLVPNPEMLPRESIRFFALDPYWITYLIEGALSVGSERINLSSPPKYLLGAAAEPKIFTGFMLRSEIVGDYPNMQINGYEVTPTEAGLDEKTQEFTEADTSVEFYSPIVRRQLSSEVMLCLFDTEIKTLDLHLKKETLHLGFDYANGKLQKKVRNPGKGNNDPDAGLEVGDFFDTDPYVDGNRILDISALIKEMDAEINLITGISHTPITSAHQFTMQMMTGVPKGRFIIGDG